MPRRPRLALLLPVAAAALVSAVPVPSPVHVQPGASSAPEGQVAWVPPVQLVSGEPGELVAVDLALDDGTEHDVDAALSVRDVDVDAVAGPRAVGSSTALRLAARRVVLRPGERGAFRAVAEIPSEPTVVGVEAELAGDPDARPVAIVVLAPDGRHAELTATVTVRGRNAEVTIANASPFPALVDLGVAATTWLGPADDLQVGDVLVPASGERTVAVELSRGVGRRSVTVAAAARGAPAGAMARAAASAWPRRTPLVVAAAALTTLAGAVAIRSLRRS